MDKDFKMIVLIADDDPDDRFLIKDAFDECNFKCCIHMVEDGEELTEYLQRRAKYSSLIKLPLPRLILLDINMPRKDGREVLVELKSDPIFRSIPTVVFTTSNAEEDILQTYDLGVNSFVIKPSTFKELVTTIKTLSDYWFGLVSMPLQAEAQNTL